MEQYSLNTIFKPGGRPFFSIGGQTHNSSSQSEAAMERAWLAAEKAGINTIAAPIYWSLLEPEEGAFDFTQADMLLEGARRRSLKLVPLWFGTWKNGASHYVPDWVKRQKERFVWARTVSGARTRILSPHCGETLEADRKAFAALLEHLRQADRDGVVLGVQVQNEPGLLGTPRDYSELGEGKFAEPVPAGVLDWLEGADPCPVKDAWVENGCRKGLAWGETFGKLHAAEIFTAHAVAGYINRVAEGGKVAWDIPLYVNVWLGEMYNRVAGIDYPSGGATSRMLDFWKAFAPQIDAVCPDVYFNDARSYDQICRAYARKDNPLYIPESASSTLNAINTMRGIVEHGLSGIHCFGIDSLVDDDGEIREECREFAGALRALSSMRPLIERYGGTNRIHAVAQYEGSASQYIGFGDFAGRAIFMTAAGDVHAEGGRPHLDANHRADSCYNLRGKGLIVYEGNGSFYLAGEGFRLNLIPKTTIEEMNGAVHASNFHNFRHMRILELSEGHFDESGQYVADRIRTGDESDNGVWVHADVGVVRLLLETEG